jgi:hypothetical protein
MPIRNVGDAMRELKRGASPHIQSRAQAIAVGLSEQRRLRRGAPTCTKCGVKHRTGEHRGLD